MIARAQAHGSLAVVSDQRLQPTFTADLALAIVEAVSATGLLHLTASDACSWYEFTCAILALAGLDIPLVPTTTKLDARGVDRPLNGVLASTRLPELQLAPMRSWREGLADYMARAGLAASSFRLD